MDNHTGRLVQTSPNIFSNGLRAVMDPRPVARIGGRARSGPGGGCPPKKSVFFDLYLKCAVFPITNNRVV